MYTAGQGLVFKGGYGGLAGVNQPVATVAEAEQAVNAQADKGVDVIKLWLDDELGTMPKMPAAMSQAIIDAAHKRNVRVLAHIFYLEDATSPRRARASTGSCTACATSRSIRHSSTA